jgi:hypothetical protein
MRDKNPASNKMPGFHPSAIKTYIISYVIVREETIPNSMHRCMRMPVAFLRIPYNPGACACVAAPRDRTSIRT